MIKFFFSEDFITYDFQWVETDGVVSSYAYDFSFFDESDKCMVSLDIIDKDEEQDQEDNEKYNTCYNSHNEQAILHSNIPKTIEDSPNNENEIKYNIATNINNDMSNKINMNDYQKKEQNNKNNIDVKKESKLSKEYNNVDEEKKKNLYVENENNFVIMYSKIINIRFYIFY